MFTPQERINLNAKQFLKDTDWYIIREQETGIPCPQEIKDARAEARQQIVEE